MGLLWKIPGKIEVNNTTWAKLCGMIGQKLDPRFGPTRPKHGIT